MMYPISFLTFDSHTSGGAAPCVQVELEGNKE